ncbi:acyl-CoA desaturase 1-like [Tetranychus urticae]|uniref:Fatty acid desaturase domain-containing protein n=1 Tax=Tetranychus urticae TaxID=32264 RepID=T1K2K5_TETUR|nr:acyl-CoA desaturase 1-like [Tetranychus urticae]
MKTKNSTKPDNHKFKLKFWKTLFFLYVHTFIPWLFYIFYYLYCYPEEIHNFVILTIFSAIYAYSLAGLGVTAGAHRFWSHKSYKAKLPLRIFLAIAFDASGQHDLISWVTDHRLHHKYSETDADPHNARRGFFFSHIGWLCVKKHPEYLKKAPTVDLSDLYDDPVVVWERRLYYFTSFTTVVIIPIAIPYYLWSIPFWQCYFIAGIRYLVVMHITFAVNSAAHLWGSRPYDRNINPAEQDICKWFMIGEFYHNFHHTFPRDYKASEWGWMQLNIAAMFIELMALIGQAYDLQTTPRSVVVARKKRTGEVTGN